MSTCAGLAAFPCRWVSGEAAALATELWTGVSRIASFRLCLSGVGPSTRAVRFRLSSRLSRIFAAEQCCSGLGKPPALTRLLGLDDRARRVAIVWVMPSDATQPSGAAVVAPSAEL